MVYCFMAQSNTFQAVVARSGEDIYGIGLYADGLLQWASTDDGISAFPLASVAYYDNGVGFSLNGSRTCSVIYTASRTNVDNPGMLVVHLSKSPVYGNSVFILILVYFYSFW